MLFLNQNVETSSTDFPRSPIPLDDNTIAMSEAGFESESAGECCMRELDPDMMFYIMDHVP